MFSQGAAQVPLVLFNSLFYLRGHLICPLSSPVVAVCAVCQPSSGLWYWEGVKIPVWKQNKIKTTSLRFPSVVCDSARHFSHVHSWSFLITRSGSHAMSLDTEDDCVDEDARVMDICMFLWIAAFVWNSKPHVLAYSNCSEFRSSSFEQIWCFIMNSSLSAAFVYAAFAPVLSLASCPTVVICSVSLSLLFCLHALEVWGNATVFF